MSAQALAVVAPPPNAAARQNLVFGWHSIPYILENCLQSRTCAGGDRKLIEDLAQMLRLSADKQPVFMFYREPLSEFCVRSRDVYFSSRIWLSAIQVCEPRLYDPTARIPLWSPSVSQMEMAEVAFLKTTPLDEGRIAELATRIVELSALRLRERRSGNKALEQLRLLSIEDGETFEMPFSRLMTPQNDYTLNTLAMNDHPCEKYNGWTTTKVSLKKASWNVPDTIERTGRTMVSGGSDAVVECRFGTSTALYRGRYEWRLDFQYKSANRFDGEKMISRFRELVPVSPAR